MAQAMVATVNTTEIPTRRRNGCIATSGIRPRTPASVFLFVEYPWRLGAGASQRAMRTALMVHAPCLLVLATHTPRSGASAKLPGFEPALTIAGCRRKLDAWQTCHSGRFQHGS